MIVFKNYLKVAKSYRSIIIIYTAIFLTISIFTSTSGSNEANVYTSSKTKIAMINEGKDSALIKGFQSYVEEHATLVDLENEENELKDALFFRKVDYIMIIPANYTEDFMNGKNPVIETMQVPDSYGTIYSKELMNQYINTARIYIKAGIDQETMVSKIKEDLSKSIEVNFEAKENVSKLQTVANFYNFSNYILLAIIIVVISMVMLSFHNRNIENRNIISAFPYKKMNRQLLLGNVVIALAIWLIYVIISCVLYHEVMFTSQGLLYGMNSLVLTIFVLSFSFFLTTLTNNREVISGVSNVVGLGTSFIAGAFVPQELLGDFVLNIARVTPSYYFIENNNKLTTLSTVDWNSLQPIIVNMIIILLFALFFYFFSQVVTKIKRKK